MFIGCDLSSSGIFETFLPGKLGLGTPGCLTSEDEERETWTAESLRVSISREFGLRKRFWVFKGLGLDERLRRYTFT